MEQRGRTGKGIGARHAVAPIAALLTLALFTAVATAGVQVPDSRRTPAPPQSDPLDYRRDPSARVTPVRAEFIADQLGQVFATPARGVAAASASAETTDSAARSALETRAAAAAKNFRCVNGRQTEDPLSPPCDDSEFDGDNGGATWKGVSRDEVRVLVRIEGGDLYAPPAPARSISEAGSPPADSYVDLGLPPRPDEPIVAGALRDLQTYFNQRYQTFNRAVRLIVYFDDGYSHPEEANRQLAIENVLIAQPFASVSLSRDIPFMDTYLETLATRGIVSFDGALVRSQRFFDRQPNRLWGYHATVEQQAELYASYVCQKVARHPVTLSGDPAAQGRPRRLGFLHTSNPSLRDYRELAQLIRQRLAACGAPVVEEATYRTNGEQCTNLPHEQDEQDLSRARADLRRFRDAGVTTVLWPGCPTSAHPLAASIDGWLPEWVLLGDAQMSQAALAGTFAGAVAVWDGHAVMVSARPFQPPVWKTQCWAAMDEADPDEDELAGRFPVCDSFGALQQIFAGIQLAGPRLTPDTLSAGYRRLRVSSSPDPQVPTCSYEQGDAACIKDAQALMFDVRRGVTEFDLEYGVSSSLPYLPASCWRAVERGRRYLPGAWPAGNVDAQFRPDDPCTYDQQQVVREGITVGRL
ncbi:MAG TPA: hypothetical protein VNB24_03380 [Acidimicrobiales bacterium]|nr:hypothetical protein [Acidimicrobiales bacterium]